MLAVIFTVLTLKFSITTKSDANYVSNFDMYAMACVILLILIALSHAICSGMPAKVFSIQKQLSSRFSNSKNKTITFADDVELADNISFAALAGLWILWNIYFTVKAAKLFKPPVRVMKYGPGDKDCVVSAQGSLKDLERAHLKKFSATQDDVRVLKPLVSCKLEDTAGIIIALVNGPDDPQE